MKTFTLVLLVCCLMFPLSAAGIQGDSDSGSPGVKFEQQGFKEILAAAQKENKLVLLDAFTDT